MVRLNIDFFCPINKDEAPSQILTEFLSLVGTEHVLTAAYSKEENAENAIVERANKEVNRHVRHVCFDGHIKSN